MTFFAILALATFMMSAFEPMYIYWTMIFVVITLFLNRKKS